MRSLLSSNIGQGIIGVPFRYDETGHFYDFGTALFRYSSESDRTKADHQNVRTSCESGERCRSGHADCATTVVSPAGASGSSIGSFTLTGQVVAKLKTSKEIKFVENLDGTSIR